MHVARSSRSLPHAYYSTWSHKTDTSIQELELKLSFTQALVGLVSCCWRGWRQELGTSVLCSSILSLSRPFSLQWCLGNYFWNFSISLPAVLWGFKQPLINSLVPKLDRIDYSTSYRNRGHMSYFINFFPLLFLCVETGDPSSQSGIRPLCPPAVKSESNHWLDREFLCVLF